MKAIADNSEFASDASRIVRRRARSDDAKEVVRSALLAAGRHAFANEAFETVSLRSIAAAAGYAPSVVYRYFADRQALYLAIRQTDLEQALEKQERFAMRIGEPELRLRQLFVYAVMHWVEHEDHYDVLYARTRYRQPMVYQDGASLGNSVLAARGVAVWEKALREMFDTLPRYPATLRVATDTLLIAMHGVISVPTRLRSRKWSQLRKLAEHMIDLLITGWRNTAQSKPRR